MAGPGPAPVSVAIRRLDPDLGVPIVQRGRRFAGLTPEGERVLLWAHRILAETAALRQDLSSMRSGLTGTLRLAAIPTALTATSLCVTLRFRRNRSKQLS
jgi:DNA-binding transcriptional LysR family regulator